MYQRLESLGAGQIFGFIFDIRRRALRYGIYIQYGIERRAVMTRQGAAAFFDATAAMFHAVAAVQMAQAEPVAAAVGAGGAAAITLYFIDNGL